MAKFYTVKQVAEALGFSTNTVYKYLEEGKIQATRLGEEGRFRIPEAEVVRLLQLKGEHPQIAPNLEKAEAQNAVNNALPQAISPPQQTLEELEEIKEDYNLKLGLLNKVSNPDLFDWFLSLTAIFLGIAFFLLPLHQQYITFEPYRLWLMLLKISLIVLGMGLMAADVFVVAKKMHHHLLVRLPLTLVFASLAFIFYSASEQWSASYFASLAVFSVLPIFYSGGPFIKFIGFVYFLTVFSGWVWAQNPQAFIFVDMRDFVWASPGLFETLLIAGSTMIAAMMIFTYYKNQPLSMLLSWFVSALFFLLSISFITDQAWNKAVVTLMIGSFALIFPFYKQFDTLSKFSRRDILVSFSWLVLILAVGVSVIFYTQTTFKNFVLKESQKRVETASKLVDSFLQDSIKYTNNIAQNPSLLKLVSAPKIQREELEELIKAQYQGATTLKRVAVFDSKGEVLAVYPPDSVEIAKVNVSDREYFKQAKNLKKTIVSELLESKIAKGLSTIVVATPIIDAKGDVLGVVGGGIDSSQLQDKLTSIEFGETGFFALADNKKSIFIHKDNDLIGQQVNLNSALIKGVEGRSGQAEGYSEQGILSIQAYTHIPSVGWGIVAQQPVSEAFRDSSLISFAIFLITIFSGVGALLVTMYLKKRQL